MQILSQNVPCLLINPNNSNVPRPLSIMKSALKFRDTNSLLQNNDTSTYTTTTTTCTNTNQDIVLVNNAFNNGSSSSSDMSSPGASNIEEKKVPKVRFNLDIDYENEREWSRVNRIIVDASKSQIEWTQEVEVWELCTVCWV